MRRKTVFKSFCLAQNLSSFLFEMLLEVVSELQKERYVALTHGKFKKTAMPQLHCREFWYISLCNMRHFNF